MQDFATQDMGWSPLCLLTLTSVLTAWVVLGLFIDGCEYVVDKKIVSRVVRTSSRIIYPNAIETILNGKINRAKLFAL